MLLIVAGLVAMVTAIACLVPWLSLRRYKKRDPHTSALWVGLAYLYPTELGSAPFIQASLADRRSRWSFWNFLGSKVSPVAGILSIEKEIIRWVPTIWTGVSPAEWHVAANEIGGVEMRRVRFTVGGACNVELLTSQGNARFQIFDENSFKAAIDAVLKKR